MVFDFTKGIRTRLVVHVHLIGCENRLIGMTVKTAQHEHPKDGDRAVLRLTLSSFVGDDQCKLVGQVTFEGGDFPRR